MPSSSECVFCDIAANPPSSKEVALDVVRRLEIDRKCVHIDRTECLGSGKYSRIDGAMVSWPRNSPRCQTHGGNVVAKTYHATVDPVTIYNQIVMNVRAAGCEFVEEILAIVNWKDSSKTNRYMLILPRATQPLSGTRPPKSLDDLSTRVKHLICICRGLQHLNGLGIIHGRVKPSNMLIYGDIAKITYFGDTEHDDIDGGGANNPVGKNKKKGTILPPPAPIDKKHLPYLAPECYVSGPKKGRISADTYSLGVCIAEALSGQPPWDSQLLEDEKEFIKLVTAKNAVPPPLQLPDKFLEIKPCREFQQIVNRCIAYNAASRPAMGLLLSSLRQIDGEIKSMSHGIVTRASENAKWAPSPLHASALHLPAAPARLSTDEMVRQLFENQIRMQATIETQQQTIDQLVRQQQQMMKQISGTQSMVLASASGSPKKCALAALEADPNDANSWFALAEELVQKETVTIQGRQLGKIQCYLESLRCEPNQSRVWVSIGNSHAMSLPSSVLTVGMETFCRKDCFIKALSISNSRNAEAWKGLSVSLHGYAEAEVDGKKYTKSEAMEQAKKILAS